MGAVALRQPFELGGDAQDGLAWLERGRQTPAELRSASQNLFDGAWTGEQRHLARKAVKGNRVQAERGADAAYRLPRSETDVNAQPKCAERWQAGWGWAGGAQALGTVACQECADRRLVE